MQGGQVAKGEGMASEAMKRLEEVHRLGAVNRWVFDSAVFDSVQGCIFASFVKNMGQRFRMMIGRGWTARMRQKMEGEFRTDAKLSPCNSYHNRSNLNQR